MRTPGPGYAPVPTTEKVPQRMAVPQSTAKVTERKPVPQSTAKGFAVLDDLEDEDGFDIFAGLDAKEWRIERRYRTRKDGARIMYWNYRRRKIRRDEDGNRRIEYRTGGSKEI
jgi:hypothetical protein